LLGGLDENMLRCRGFAVMLELLHVDEQGTRGLPASFWAMMSLDDDEPIDFSSRLVGRVAMTNVVVCSCQVLI